MGSPWGAQWIVFLLPDPAAPGLIPRVHKKNSVIKTVNIANVNQRHYLEESGQWLENVDRTHQVLASGKLVLQKHFCPGRQFQFVLMICHETIN